MIKNLLAICLIMTTIISVTAQVTNEGTPLSWSLDDIDMEITEKALPSFDLEAVKAEDEENDNNPTKPWRFGYMHSVDYGLQDGQWTTLENGDRIWRLLVSSKGALSINFVFDNFYLPKGAHVYLYSDDRSDLLGAYTHVQNQESGILGTWLVEGEKVWIELYEPSKVANQSRLHIAKATHGYRNAQTFREAKGLNDSGNCNLDVDCPIGEDWSELKDHNKKSVGILLSGSSGFCTGALINNTSNDGTPYFLTANHCYSDPAGWAFRFGWISPDPICAEATDSTDGPTDMTISGGTLRARSTNADFCLVEINSDIPEDWDVVYAGWDRTDNFPEFTVGIHHPAGDIMKVCRDDDQPIKAPNGGPVAQTWEVTTAGGGWELGVTEPGSSGSPLFDHEGKIIGQLYGGGAACSGTNDNGQLDYYGRFAVSWDEGSSESTRLREWLDPTDSGIEIMESFPAFEVLALDGALTTSLATSECGITSVEPAITLRNLGANDITQATIEYTLDGGATQTIEFSETLAQNEVIVYNLDAVDNGADGSTIVANLVSVNNGDDLNLDNNTASASVAFDIYSTSNIILDLTTDDYAEETSWEFRNSAGDVLYAGAYADDEDNTTFQEVFELPLDNECYSFIIFDSFGDGICCGFGDGSYSLSTQEGTVIFEGGQFAFDQLTEIATENNLSTADNNLQSVGLYPNPANETITIDLGTSFDNKMYTIYNTTGQKVVEGKLTQLSTTIDIQSVTTGLYFVKIEDQTTGDQKTIRFIKK